MKLAGLLTEQSNPASKNIDTLSTPEILRIINDEDSKVAPAVRSEIPRIAQAVETIAGAIERGGRLFYIGAGTSGRLGVLDAAECPPTFHVSPETVQGIIAGGAAALEKSSESAEDDPEAGRRALEARNFTSGDVLVGITVGISCTPDSELAEAAQIAITPLPGAEVIAGSTRMKAGTATKLVLNMISTAVMIRLGYVYDNLMVNVQPRNSKLEDRARRIIVEAAGVDPARAAKLLEEAGGNLKVAIVMAKLGMERSVAESRLDAAGGRVASVLKG